KESEGVSVNYTVAVMNVVIEGITGLTIKVGGSFITLSPAGVQIMGPTVMINSGGAPLVAAPLMAVSPMVPHVAEIADTAVPGMMDETNRKLQAATSLGEPAAKEAPLARPPTDESQRKEH